MTKPIADGLVRNDEGTPRCWWCGDDPLYIIYHHEEWGFPVDDDQRLFEKICLEGFQSGLSWLTILRKRENFRRAFDRFKFRKVATFGSRKVSTLLADAGIIRHKGKINATINNAQRAIELVDEFGSLAKYFWQYEPRKSQRPKKITRKNIPSTTPESVALSEDLKKRGWKFVGPTTMYAFMQAMGVVNDHVHGCETGQIITKIRADFVKPG